MVRSDVVEKKALLGENGQNDNSAARRCCMQNKWRHDCAKKIISVSVLRRRKRH